MSTIHLVGDRRLAYVKGAAEVARSATTLTPDEQAAALAAAAEMERSALPGARLRAPRAAGR